MTTAQLKTGAAVELQNAVSTAMSTFMKAANHAVCLEISVPWNLLIFL